MDFGDVKLRSFDDFVGPLERYQLPSLNDQKFCNRVRCNFLYYQANYYLLFAIFGVLAVYFQPVGIAVLIGLTCLCWLYLMVNLVTVVHAKTVRIATVMVVCALIGYFYDHIFTTALFVLLPLLLSLVHAIFRMRNLKNKVHSTLDQMEVSPMGQFLDRLGLKAEYCE